MCDTEELLKDKNLLEMLEFETQIFLDILQTDGLVICAKGISLDIVLSNLFKVYCDPGNLVLVLNCSEFEEKYFVEKLNDPNVHSTTFTTNTTEREDVYLSGGVHFVTTRILVVDMLKKRIPIEKITGFIILRAHSIVESCQEAFVLRLYRQHNKTGFVKGFSNCAQSFTYGFGHVERVMRTIFVKELYLWPRFHGTVVQNLKQHEPRVIELHIPITEKMKKVQTCILELMNLTVKELKRINKTLEMQEITVENCLTKKFHKILQNQLDCIWHQLSEKTKQLIADLKVLRHLIILLFYSDFVTFYATLISYRSLDYAKSAYWVLLEPTELLFTHSSSLIYTGDKEFNPEMCPKWNSFLQILKVEIPTEMRKTESGQNKVLILCQDAKTCFQLNQFLKEGGYNYLFLIAIRKGLKFKTISDKFKDQESLMQIYKKKEVAKTSVENAKFSKVSKVDSDENKEDDKSSSEDIEDLEYMNSYVLTMSQTFSEDTPENVDENGSFSADVTFQPFPEMENMNLTQLLEAEINNTQPTILIQTFKNGDNSLSLQKTLEEVSPNFIIMYHSNMTAVRQIEIYEARRKKDRPLNVYFLVHAETVEEQSYLTTLRREKEAFEFLIQTKSTMVVPDAQDGKSEECLVLQRELRNQELSTRQGGGQTQPIYSPKIIVDMREFRSELPSLIHKRGVDIEPLTITVGDYILTKDICVERKSLSDLVGSLKSGRLYQQCTQMARYYTKPMLLIEFDQNKPFSWQSNYMVSSDESSFNIQEKLLLLTLHFPKLKIVWSPSPYASAQLFEELKEGKEEPDIQYATSIGSENDMDIIEATYNSTIYDFIQKLPGITSKNFKIFLRKFKNLDEVAQKTEEELKIALENSTEARMIYSILHEEHKPPMQNQEQFKGKSNPRNKFKFVKRKK